MKVRRKTRGKTTIPGDVVFTLTVNQTSPTVQDFGLTYRLVSDVGVYWTNYYDTNWFALNVPGLTTNDYAARVKTAVIHW